MIFGEGSGITVERGLKGERELKFGLGKCKKEE